MLRIRQHMLILDYQHLILFSRFLGGQREATTRYLYFKNTVDAKIHPLIYYKKILRKSTNITLDHAINNALSGLDV